MFDVYYWLGVVVYWCVYVVFVCEYWFDWFVVCWVCDFYGWIGFYLWFVGGVVYGVVFGEYLFFGCFDFLCDWCYCWWCFCVDYCYGYCVCDWVDVGCYLVFCRYDCVGFDCDVVVV